MDKIRLNIKLDGLIFLCLILLVAILQTSLLDSQLSYGFMPDDWWPLYEYKLLVSSNPLDSIRQVWERHGIYTAYQIYYIGILENFFGFNFHNYHLTNQIFKGISALLLYPLVLIIFRRRLLAFLAVLLYGMHYSPVGTLEITAKGSDYLAISIMSVFMIVYTFIVRDQLKGFKWLVTGLVLMLLALLLSPIRMYPMLVFILLIEAYLLIGNRDKKRRLASFKRLALFYSPFLLAFLITPESFTRFIFINPGPKIQFISNGNWQMILSPFASLGSTFIDDWRMFGYYNIENFSNYLTFISGGPLVIFGTLTFLLSFIFSQKRFNFFIKVFLTNLVLELFVYFIITHQRLIDSSLQTYYDPANIYSILGGVYVLVLSCFFYIEWKNTGKKNNIFFVLWSSMAFSLIFIWLTWLLSDPAVVFKGVHSYLTVPAIGTSILLSAVIVGSYDKLRSISSSNKGKLIAPLVFLILIPIYNQSQTVTQMIISSFLENGMNAREQQNIRNELWNKTENYDSNKSNLFFLYTLEDQPNGRFYEVSLIRFSEWFFFWSGQNEDRCLAARYIFENKEKLIESIKLVDGKRVIIYPNSCGVETVYDSDNFYAFKLKERMPIDIKHQLIKELGIE